MPPLGAGLNPHLEGKCLRQRLISYVEAIERLGPEGLANIPSLSLSKLSAVEWSNMLYKHLDHHLRQFGV